MPRKRGGPTNPDQRRKEGYGEGEGADYKPWLNVRTVPSHGMAHRIHGLTTGRTHHFFSNHELGCFLLLDWSDAVIDIREQFPLHSLADTQDIAEELGYRHPSARRTKKGVTSDEPIVMTSDFLVTLSEGAGAPEIAVAVKPTEDLKKPRTLEKLEIERRYWERREIPWQIVTERDLPTALIANLQFVLPYQSLEDYGLPQDQVSDLLDDLFEIVTASPTVPLNRVCQEADGALGLPTGGSLTLTWHAIATQAWRVDLRTPLNPDQPLRSLSQGRTS